MSNRNEGRKGKHSKSGSPQGAQVRIAEAFLEGKNGAACSQKSGQRPVHQAQVLIANESVKYQRNVGAPHEHNDALEVELETE